MSNWFDDSHTPENEQQPIIPPPPAESPAAPSPIPPADPYTGSSTPIPPVDSYSSTDQESRTSAGPIPPVEPVSGTGTAPNSGSTAPTGEWSSSPYSGTSSWTHASADQTPTDPAAGGSNGGSTPPPYSPYGSWGSQSSGPSPEPPKKKKSKSGIAIAILASVCAVTIVSLAVLLAVSFGKENAPSPSTSDGSSTSSQVENPNAPTLDIDDSPENDGGKSAKQIIQENVDSTVVISMYGQTTTQNNPFGFGGWNNSNGELRQVGSATGIIMSADGYIITNWHCVINEDTKQAYSRIDVTTYDGTVYSDAKIVGADEDTDLAVIKINAANLSTATFGDSSQLSMGDRVVALGNAGGLQWSASQGIISGLARDVYEDTGYSIKCLQTDAAINPGNSGGPLLNNQGQVIGINSAKIAAEGYEGLGFSIPIKEAKSIIDDLIKYGYVKGRVMLGITGVQVDTPNYEGFMINSIEDNSVLEGTKAQAGDIITHVNGVRVKTYEAMRTELTKYQVGNQIELTLLRIDPQTRQTVSFNVTCTLGESQG